ncbi:ATP-dependent DNA helicase RecG [Paenibacillus mucilaginosus]|uniref:ATP-dependent DNA helicase RecG n=3 Tax=Paenibacillus mucilaginosus TaxID=61624 RepID=H6NQV2_9BACL|nr:ATP-dependent DNA helicase RecG [Paenibacillus mucilaginosus]AEI44418.1 RecG [Paenibacillus mucilaginosus KNP414]AFC31945.1 RecG [Paenibacillus mucilaginosus 3016]AFH64308.2 ATP-dependent DNA helicase [Paenibacillus mucilaginosus K02]MCG7213793.1 ATP-dependent DNA helicase RecG [Paenibacillus mucilaginosus]WDM25805.1 ATP-dependent DNA helicase RecG [Paenibacillus mucilaginosus]
MLDLYSLPVTQVSGVKGKKPEELLGLGISSVGQLLDYYPFRYEDYTLRDLTQVKDGDKITVQGTIVGVPLVQMYGRTKSRLTCKVVVDPLFVTAVWFNRHYLRDKLTAGAEVVLTGKWDQKRLQLTVTEVEFPGQGTSQIGTLQPVYSLTAALTQKWFRQAMKQALVQYGEMIPEVLPQELLQKYGLLPRKQAVTLLHLPGNMEQGQRARRRMVYEELFLFQLKMQAYRALNHERADGVAHPVDLPAVRAFVRSLPFTLTDSQKNVLAEILQDLQQPHCMNRLLQGDVGAGKTVVAASALFAVVKAGYQGALMVPTEILAEQHKRSLDRLFEPYGIQTALLTGSLTDRQRREILASLQMGMIDVVVGTHALIQEDVFFRRLGLVVTDEQHRFGVNQRSILRRKGMNPDVLTMTATPIPRTLAITAFGDMDVSTLRELPKGRKPIKTYAVTHGMLERVLGFIRREVAAGRQAYVICPLIEESEKLDVQNAIDVHAQLQFEFPDYKVGLLHGRMTPGEKDEVMREFSAGRVHVLVSTTVIEVGVDVPNATLMVVYDADRFGLSQLHQLRGRVGRGEHQSYCVLIADPKNEVGKERMKAMTDTNDGFEIARRDLELRGPGDFFGTKQSGVPDFRLADMVTDFEVMEQARDDAAELVKRPEFWTGTEYTPLREFLQREQILSSEMLD